jgi:alkylation response protein AidB-like acyl-CoA dehydrogenase
MPNVQRARDLFDQLDAIGSTVAIGESFNRKVLKDLSDAGLVGLTVAKEAGGKDLPLAEAVEVWEELSRADGSIGWCAFAADSALTYLGSYLPDDGLAELLSHTTDTSLPVVAGRFAPTGSATISDGSWVLTGDYQFGSGLRVADVVGAGFFADRGDGSDPAYLMGWLPVSAVELRGNWDVLGLRATQSIDYHIESAKVPDSHTFEFLSPKVYRGSAKHWLGVLPLTAAGHAAWALGVGRRMLDELVHIAARTRLGATSSLGGSEHFLINVARLESRLRSARAWVSEVCEQAESECDERGDWVSVPTANLVRQACVHANREAVGIAREAYSLAGTPALREGPMQRCFRDLHAGTQHYFASDAASIDFAQGLLDT